jgi:hypothetical protein
MRMSSNSKNPSGKIIAPRRRQNKKENTQRVTLPSAETLCAKIDGALLERTQ